MTVPVPASAALYFRLRIRNAADSADLLIISSVPSDTNPYLESPPSGDGTAIDVVTGSTVNGVFICRVIDVLTGGVTRVLTSQLADANGNPQLANLRAYVEQTTDPTWATSTQLSAGYIIRIRYTDALLAEVHVGEGARAEQRAVAFATVTASFPKGTNIIGEPIPGGWGPVPAMGQFRFKVKAVYPTHVTLSFVQAPLPFKWRDLTYGSKGYFKFNSAYASDNPAIRGDFPRLMVEATSPTTGAVLATYRAVAAPLFAIAVASVGMYEYAEWGLVGPDNTVRMAWPSSGGPAQPSVGDLLLIRAYPLDVSAAMPLHVKGHPVDIYTGLWTDAGIDFDASIAAAVKAAMGSTLLMLLYITGPMSVADAQSKLIGGLTGLAARTNPANGKRELVLVRKLPSALPSEMLDPTVIKSNNGVPSGTPYDLDESTSLNRVTFKTKSFAKWGSGVGQDPATKPNDLVVVQDKVLQVDNGQVATYGAHEASYDIPGYAFFNNFAGSGPEDDFYIAIANELFDRFGSGGIQYELDCLDGVASREGDFCILNLPDVPNAVVGASPVSQRGGQRVVQLTKRTNAPGGPALVALDAGAAAQPTLAPTFTLTALAADPKHFAVFAITNVAALIAAGVTVVYVQTETTTGSPAGGSQIKRIVLATDPASFTLPKMVAGSTVQAQARSVQPNRIPGAWTAWTSVTLTAYGSVTGLTTSAGADNTSRVISFGNTELVGDVRVRWRPTGWTSWEFVRWLAPGSTGTTLTFLVPGAGYDVEVVLMDRLADGGVGPAATVSFTAGSAVPTMPTPWSPAGWAGAEQGLGFYEVNGSFGIDVTAASYPSYISAEVAVETGVGTGVYGSYQVFSQVESVQGYRSRTRLSSMAPNDGLRRKLRAQATYPNATASAYTAEVVVNPWVAQAPKIPVVAPPAPTIAGIVAGTIASPVDMLTVSYGVPAEPAFDYVRYRIRQRTPGSSTWGHEAYISGGRDGSDLLPVAANVEVEIRLDTVNTDGVISSSGTPVTAITPPFAGPTLWAYNPDYPNPVAPLDLLGFTSPWIVSEPNRIHFFFVPSDDCVKVRVYSKEYAAAPPATCPELDDGLTAPTWVRNVTPGQIYSVAFPRTAGGIVVAVEVVPFDRYDQRGNAVYITVTPDPTAVPAALTAASNVSVPVGGSSVPQVVTNSITSASATNPIRCYRNGLFYADLGTFAVGAHNVTHVASSNASDIWEYCHVDSTYTGVGRESARTTPFTTNTPQLAAQTGVSPLGEAIMVAPDGTWSLAYNVGSCSSNPAGTTAILQRATSGAGPWTDVQSTLLPDLPGSTSVIRASYLPGSGAWYFRVIYRALGLTDSPATAVAGPYPFP